MKKERNDFELQWQRRQQAMQRAQSNAPADDVVLAMAKKAQEKGDLRSAEFVPVRRRFRWVPYAAAASILLGVSVIGWQRMTHELRLPETKVVSVNGQTIRFLCNSGCSADDVFRSAQNIITE